MPATVTRDQLAAALASAEAHADELRTILASLDTPPRQVKTYPPGRLGQAMAFADRYGPNVALLLVGAGCLCGLLLSFTDPATNRIVHGLAVITQLVLMAIAAAYLLLAKTRK